MDIKNKSFKVVTYIDRINSLSDIFISYYLKFFNKEEFCFLILDEEFETVSNYLLDFGFMSVNFKSVSNEYFGTDEDIIDLQNKEVNEFLDKDFIVVYADIDEIIYHHDLRNYILENLEDYITPTGIVIIPNLDESNLRTNDKLLNQRRYCIFDNVYHSKTCILNKTYTWTGGRHNKRSNRIYDDIFLIDIGRSCLETILENNKITNKIYKSVTPKYSTEEKRDIEKMIFDLIPRLKLLPGYILNTKLI